jgi:uncharacterized YigZ family protein
MGIILSIPRVSAAVQMRARPSEKWTSVIRQGADAKMCVVTSWLPRGYKAETHTEVKRSRFVCTLARVDSEQEARDVIGETRSAYPDARHHCSAFIVEVPDAQPVERSSDDGEPAGTAGMPMLEVLRGAGLSQVVAVVTRYFGGVLLGTGGLVRAYSEAVSEAIGQAPRVRPEVRDVFSLTVDHAQSGRVHAGLLDRGCEVVDADFGESVVYTFAVPDAEAFVGWVAELTNGEVVPTLVGETLSELPIGAS